MNYTERFPTLFKNFAAIFNQDWDLDYFSAIEALREVVLCWYGKEIEPFIKEFADLLELQCSEDEWKYIKRLY